MTVFYIIWEYEVYIPKCNPIQFYISHFLHILHNLSALVYQVLLLLANDKLWNWLLYWTVLGRDRQGHTVHLPTCISWPRSKSNKKPRNTCKSFWNPVEDKDINFIQVLEMISIVTFVPCEPREKALPPEGKVIGGRHCCGCSQFSSPAFVEEKTKTQDQDQSIVWVQEQSKSSRMLKETNGGEEGSLCAQLHK